MSQFIIHQWNIVKTSMDAADITFVLLRTVILWGLGGWLIFSPLAQTTILFVSNLTIFFVIYTIFIYNFLFFLPERKRIIYGFSLFFDFLFTVLLVKETGGFESAFTNGFYLMTALYSFYFGSIAAAIIAGAATFLYCVSGGFDFSGLYWTDFSVRVAFIFLLAIPLGMLSQKLKRDKEKIEILNRDLEQFIKKQQKVSDSSSCERLS